MTQIIHTEGDRIEGRGKWQHTVFDNVTDIIKKTIESEEETKRVIAGEQTKRVLAGEYTKRVLAEEETKRMLAEQQTQRLAAEADAYRVKSEAEVKRATAVAFADVKRIEAETAKIQAEKEKIQIEKALPVKNNKDVTHKRTLDVKNAENTKRPKLYTREKILYRNRGKTCQNMSKLVLDQWLKQQAKLEPADDDCVVTVYNLVYEWFCEQDDITKQEMTLNSILVNGTEVFRVLALKENAFTVDKVVLTYVQRRLTTSMPVKKVTEALTEVHLTSAQQVLDLQCVLQHVDDVSGWYNTAAICPVTFNIPKVAEKNRIVRTWLESISTVTEKANNSFGWKVISVAMMLPEWTNDWVRTAVQMGTTFTFYPPDAVPCLYRAVMVNRNIIKKAEVAELIRRHRQASLLQ